MKDFDIHKINRKLELVIKRIKNSNISKQDKKVILEFYDYAFSIGLSKKRILKYLTNLFKLSQWLEVSFEKASKQDIMKLVSKIEQKDYTEWTKHDYKVILKRIFKWLNGDEEYPDKVKWIKTTFRKNKRKLPENLITPQEIEKMIKVADHTRDKAFIAFSYESGFRIDEILTMRIKHIVFDDFGAKIVGKGKTGMRRIRLVSSVPHLAAWIENHPFRDKPDAPLWIRIGTAEKDEILYYNNARKIIKTLAKKANIKKRIHPHLFRHSCATHHANYFTEAQMNQYFGWVQGSNMPSTYVHLSGRDLDETILEMNGLKEEKKKKKVTVTKCHKCEKINPSNGKLCIRCGTPLNIEIISKVEDKINEGNIIITTLLKDPEVQTFLENKLKQMES
jgi:integrase